MRDFIKETLVEAYKTISVDRYGQVSPLSLRDSLFGDKADEVVEYCKKNKGVLQFAIYGGRFGTYEAFSIVDEDISRACSASLSQNPDHIAQLNNW